MHFIISSRHQSQSQQVSNVLYTASCTPLFDLPKPINKTKQLPIIFGRTVDSVLSQIIDHSFRDLILPWLRQVYYKVKIFYMYYSLRLQITLYQGSQQTFDLLTKVWTRWAYLGLCIYPPIFALETKRSYLRL